MTTSSEAKKYIEKYFHELFVKRNLDALDEYLADDYYDDDIGPGAKDHKTNSRAYLKELFLRKPGIKVTAGNVTIEDNVITAYLQWIDTEDGRETILIKGIAIFEMNGQKIQKRLCP